VYTSQPLVFPPIFTSIAEILPGELKVYLVGGAVRDTFLKRDSHDLDFAVDGQAMNLARLVANQLGGAFYPLDQERDYGRVILQDENRNRFVLDFTPPIRGSSDLRLDFTVNAMAVEIHQPQVLPIPGCLADLRNKQPCACLIMQSTTIRSGFCAQSAWQPASTRISFRYTQANERGGA
jgi:tRNA nucleotidyltransferase/poly(A) polymerase